MPDEFEEVYQATIIGIKPSLSDLDDMATRDVETWVIWSGVVAEIEREKRR